MDVNQAVLGRYSGAAEQREESLCCPVDYDSSLLAMLPEEIIAKDYGCGDPSRYVRSGDTVVDLGSGGGKICYMAAQLVGEGGRVIGVDMNDDMLSLARRHQAAMAERLGEDRVSFRKGFIQDLALDLAATEERLAAQPVGNAVELSALQDWQAEQRRNAPLIPDNSVDLVISNCVLNLVREDDRRRMIEEIFRVLKPHGRVAISDIVSDESVPEHLKQDATLWSGCISGAFEAQDFLNSFAQAGFHAVGYDKWDERPWQVVEGIAFRSVTLTAVKPAESACCEEDVEVRYCGPFNQVTDDHGQTFQRGQRVFVKESTAKTLLEGYGQNFVKIQDSAEAEACCEPGGGCC